MTETVKIRQRLHNYLEIAEDKELKAIYNMVQKEIAEAAVDYTQSFRDELDRRHEHYKKNPASAISGNESKKRIREKLKAARYK